MNAKRSSRVDDASDKSTTVSNVEPFEGDKPDVQALRFAPWILKYTLSLDRKTSSASSAQTEEARMWVHPDRVFGHCLQVSDIMRSTSLASVVMFVSTRDRASSAVTTEDSRAVTKACERDIFGCLVASSCPSLAHSVLPCCKINVWVRWTITRVLFLCVIILR